MTTAIKVLLIEDNRIEARQTQQWLAAANDPPFEVEWVDHLQSGLELLAKDGIDIVLLDLNLPDSRGLDTFMKLHDRAPQLPVVVLTGEYDDRIGPMAVEKGAQDYLVKQQANGASLERVLRFSLVRHRAQLELLSKSNRVKAAKVLGFLGAKGGVGASTIALNVALALAARKHSVVLAELQPGGACLAHHLQQQPVANLSNILKLPADRISEPSLAGALCRGPADLRILFAPQPENPFREIEPEQAAAIVGGLAGMADFVIIDLPHVPTVATQATLPLCRFTALVTEREPGSLSCSKGALQRLQDSGVGSHQVGAVVVNRSIYPLSLEMSKIGAEIGCYLIGSIPCDATACLNAQESGMPIVLSAPDHDISLSILEIVQRLTAEKIVHLAF
jgi:Flp pilus assembly CpaE family ATPase